MKKNLRSICMLVICTMIGNIIAPAAKAESNIVNLETMYVDGIEYNVDLNIVSGEVIISGKNKNISAEMIMECDGEATIISEQSGRIEEYSADVRNLSKDDVDVTVYDETVCVSKEYNSYEDINKDVYEEQGAIWVAVTVADVVGTLFLIYCAYEAVETTQSVTYILLKKFYNSVAVDKANTKVEERAKEYYYPAYIKNYKTWIAPKGIKLNSASNLIKKDLSVYSFTNNMAKRVISKAGYTAVNSNGEKQSEIHKPKDAKGNYVYRHYHKGKTSSSGNLKKTGSSHSLFGGPKYVE